MVDLNAFYIEPVQLGREAGMVIIPDNEKEPKLKDGALSMAFYKDGVPVIYFLANADYIKQRFIIAHAIGHFELNHFKTKKEVFFDYLPNFNLDIEDVLELEANIFANKFLIPENMLKYLFFEESIKDEERLSEILRVPLKSITLKLEEYNLI